MHSKDVNFNEPPKILPANGAETKYYTDEANAPLKIVTKSSGNHYFVKVVDWYTNKPISAIFIHGGDSISTVLPIGSYKIRYATGGTWYGNRYLFGPSTSYSEADARFDFKTEEDHVSGYTVELYLQHDGNLRTKRISPREW